MHVVYVEAICFIEELSFFLFCGSIIPSDTLTISNQYLNAVIRKDKFSSSLILEKLINITEL